MADTPNNNLEKRLRDYAQQRRDAAGSPTLHPATRAMLQAEVKQKLGGAAANTIPPPRASLMRFWPRLAFAVGIIAVLGITAILLVPPGSRPKGNFALVKLEAAKPAMRASDKSDALPNIASAPEPAPMSAPAVMQPAAADSVPAASIYVATSAVTENFKRRSDTPVRTEPAKLLKDTPARDLAKTPANAPMIASSAVSQNAGQNIFLADGDSLKEKSAGSGGAAAVGRITSSSLKTDALVMAANQDSKTATRLAGKKAEGIERALAVAKVSQATFNNNLGAIGQRYRNVAVMEKQKQMVSPVLDEFTVAQDGEALTIVDRDGSIYNGYARIATADRQAAPAEYSNPVQLVPNSNSGGRAGATLDQRAMNRAYQQNQTVLPAEASQNIAVGQAAPSQSANLQFNYFFRVEGTNRSLNQRVVFTGNLLQNAGAYNSNVQNNSATLNFQQQVAPSAKAVFNNSVLNAPTFNNVINGRVQLGDKKPGELNALSVDQ